MADSASAGLLQRAAPAVEIKRRRRTKTPDLVTLTNEAHRGNMHLKRNLHQHEQQPVRKRFRCKTSNHETREACRRPKKPMDPQNTAQTKEAKRKKKNAARYRRLKAQRAAAPDLRKKENAARSAVLKVQRADAKLRKAKTRKEGSIPLPTASQPCGHLRLPSSQ